MNVWRGFKFADEESRAACFAAGSNDRRWVCKGGDCLSPKERRCSMEARWTLSWPLIGRAIKTMLRGSGADIISAKYSRGEAMPVALGEE